jgi:predicted hotdog family 3-hydroxylacyl-ACP dehydratase
MAELKLPLAVQDLEDLVPHRTSAIWVDSVIALSEEGGQCQVEIKDGNYMTNGSLRKSSYIEFIAQSYGFVSASHLYFNLKPDQKKISQAFLVGVKNFEILEAPPVKMGDVLRVEVTRTHEIGEISIVEGKVFSSANVCLAKGQIKLFAR